MKKSIFVILSCIMIIFMVVGCSSSNRTGATNDSSKEGTVTLPYDKPLDFKAFEVYVSTSSGFNPTGWDGSSWSGSPNSVTEWNGVDKTLHTITPSSPIQVTNLVPGTRYYFRIVVVDRANQRSDPSAEITQVAGNAQQSSTVVVAAANANPASMAGADFVCTGTDDQNIINQAINALPANGGKITLTEGTFNISSTIMLRDNTNLEGNGPSTILKLQSNSPQIYYLITNTDSTNGNVGIIIKKLTIDGNKTNNNFSLHGLVFLKNSKYPIIDTVQVINSSHDGIILSNCPNAVVQNSIIQNNGGTGIYTTMQPTTVTGNLLTNNFWGIELFNSLDTNISNNTVTQNMWDGIVLVGSSNCNISSNIVNSNSQSANNTYSNISIYGDCNSCNIQNNICRRGTLTAKPQYGIDNKLDSNTNILISSNDCYTGGVTAGIHDAGTNTSFGAGNRNNDGTWSTTPN